MSTKIKNLPHLRVDEVKDYLKIPTGGQGDVSLTVKTILDWIVSKDIFLKKEDYDPGLDKGIKDIYIPLPYEGSQGDDRFGNSSVLESINSIYGGSSPNVHSIISPYVGFAFFRFFDQSNQNLTVSPLKMVGTDTSKYKIPLSDIQHFSNSNSVLPTIFKRSGLFSQGYTYFYHEEPTPIYTNLDVYFSVLIKASDELQKDFTPSRLWLVISCEENIDSEYNKNVAIATSNDFKTSQAITLDQTGGYNARGVNYEELKQSMADVDAVIFNTIKGYIGSRSTDDILYGIGFPHKTTSWLDVPPSNRVLSQRVDNSKKTNIFRIQGIDTTGNVVYLGNDSNSDKVILFPSNIVKYRVCYGFDEVDSAEILLKNVPTDKNILSGLWCEYTLSGKVPVTLYPNKRYSFQLWKWGGLSMNLSENSFIIQSASVSTNLNYRRNIQKKYDEITKW